MLEGGVDLCHPLGDLVEELLELARCCLSVRKVSLVEPCCKLFLRASPVLDGEACGDVCKVLCVLALEHAVGEQLGMLVQPCDELRLLGSLGNGALELVELAHLPQRNMERLMGEG